MRRPRSQAPRREDIDTGQYDADYLLGPYRRLELARSVDSNTRKRGASGGVLTEICAALLEAGEIDAVLNVGLSKNAPLTPQYHVSRNRRELARHAGSVYSYISPKELVRVERELRRDDRVAIVCQPCMVPMVRKFQGRLAKDVEGAEVRYVFSFFCGYNMTLDATYYLLSKANVKPEDVEWVRYRDGEYPGGFAVKAKSGPRAGQVVRFGKESYEYLNLAFLRDGCSRCSYYMGDGADLSCGDAWLKEHRNLTSVLVRNEAGEKALAIAGRRLKRYELPEKTLMHMHLHNLIYKKHGNSLFLRVLTGLFRDVWPKALAPFCLLSWLSRQRRKRKIGTSLPTLVPVSDDAKDTNA